jgi:hypothetical protein
LDKVAGYEEVFLVRGDFDVVWADDGLGFVWVVEADGVVEVGDVYCGDVVAEGEGEVGEFSVVGDVGVDGDGVLCLVAQGD